MLPAVLCVCAIAQNCPSGSTSLDRMLPSLSGGGASPDSVSQKAGKTHEVLCLATKAYARSILVCKTNERSVRKTIVHVHPAENHIIVFVWGCQFVISCSH